MSTVRKAMIGWSGLLAPMVLGLALAAGTGTAQQAPEPAPAAATPSLTISSGSKPIEVDAPAGFEYHEKLQVAIARGGATATQGDMVLTADTLAAYFRKGQNGANEVYRLLAEGNVQLKNGERTAHGSRAIYDLDRSVAVLTGEGLRLVTPQETVTARDSLEYWRTQELAVARGDALAARPQDRIRADRLVALMARDKQDKLGLSRVDGNGNVIITTKTETARGDKGTYDLDSEKALLTGNVRITRGQNQLNGPAAEVDLKSGVSRILSRVPGTASATTPPGSPPGTTATDGRVQGLFIPNRQGQGGTPQQPSQPANPQGSEKP
ncbi:LptA/OstA family protein [Niveispirillum sp. KHB5.9]|uniref:LptA/OstA family protein n=1 Tax=Niveispirillum sp. KHB5.9 TaxID=3400269 RepID=UPI003A8410D1